jgi:transcription-repair coupling factor (superfamily II helicase)
MDLYRRIAAIRTDEDAGEVLDELLDRYGEAPRSVYALLDIAMLRSVAGRAGVVDIVQKKDVLRMKFGVFHPAAVVMVCGMAKYKMRLTLAAGDIPVLTLKLKPGEDVLEAARTLAEDLLLAVGQTEKE